MQTDTWISRTVIMLSLILMASVSRSLILMVTGQPVPEILAALACVATGGLIRLLI
jgi:hypothetical protein